MTDGSFIHVEIATNLQNVINSTINKNNRHFVQENGEIYTKIETLKNLPIKIRTFSRFANEYIVTEICHALKIIMYRINDFIIIYQLLPV